MGKHKDGLHIIPIPIQFMIEVLEQETLRVIRRGYQEVRSDEPFDVPQKIKDWAESQGINIRVVVNRNGRNEVTKLMFGFDSMDDLILFRLRWG